MLTWTDRPYETMWSHLCLLSRESNARSLLGGHLANGRGRCAAPLELLEAKARQVAYCILQAFEYYKAADAVTVDTSPLLYFYGMLSLAKALVVANDPEVLLDDIKYHGLKADKTDASTKLESRGVKADGGVFLRLTSTVQGFGYPAGALFTLKDVLSVSPELFEMFERYFEEPARCLPCYMTRTLSTKPYRVEICALAPTAEYVYQRIPEFATDFDLRPNPSIRARVFKWFTSKESVEAPPTKFWEYYAPIGGRYLVGALPFTLNGHIKKHYIQPALSDYIGMFILSDCVRYKQDLWRRVVQGQETGILGLVDLFLNIAKRRFPNLILNSLFGERFVYDSRHPDIEGLAGATDWPAHATMDLSS
jgi:hypothetical protein